MGRHTGTTTKNLTGAITTASGLPHSTTSARWRPIMPAALCAAAVGAALTVPAIASAEPREWDLEAYDKCTDEADKGLARGELDQHEFEVAYVSCCINSGGALGKDNVCEASADLQTGPQINLPPGGLPTLTAVPTTSTPSTVNLTPAPITRG